MQARTIFLAVAAMLVAVGAAQAGTVQYAIQSDGTIMHQFGWDKDAEIGHVTDYLAATWPGLTADFSQDKTLEVTFAAPAGKAFQFTMPPGLNSASLGFRLMSHGFYGAPNKDGAVTMEWLGLQGTEPSFPPTTNTWGIGTQTVWLSAGAGVTDSFSFTGFKLTYTVPVGFIVNWQDLPIFSGCVGFDAYKSDWTTDPGQMVTVVPVPEPLTMVAVGMGIAGLGGYIRRRRMAAK